MDAIIIAVGDNWHYLFAALVVFVFTAFLLIHLVGKLKGDIRLSRKIEALSGQRKTEDANLILRRMADTSTEDTILKILPTLASTKLALRQSGLPIGFVGYVAAVLLGSAILAFTWNNPVIPSGADFIEPLLNAYLINIFLNRAVLRPLAARRKAVILSQLGAAIQHVSRSVTSGQSTDRAISLAAEAAMDPLRKEMNDVVRLNGVGVPIEQAMRAAGPSIDLPEYDFFVSAIEAAMHSGGNLSRVLDELVTVIRSRRQLKLNVGAKTAEGKMSAIVLSLLPVGLLGWMSYSNPDYVEPLFSSEAGPYILYGGFIFIALGLAVMIRMVSFKV